MRSSEKSTHSVLIITTVLMTLLAMALPLQLYAAMGDYCIMPPYVKTDITPNIMIIMDNAVDMGDPAYNDPIYPNYDPTKGYDGYFQKTLKYTYGTNRWVPDVNGIYSGNLLNWATTSKYDLLQSILVGGISASRQTNVNTLISKSNMWTKTLTYDNNDGLGQRTCIFNVNNGNVAVTEPTPNACGYLDGPSSPSPYNTPHPILNDPGPNVASIEQNERLGEGLYQRDENYRACNAVNDPVPVTPGFWSTILSAVADFLVPSAEAASQLRISGGPSTLPNGIACASYNAVSISASGGSGQNYQWSVSPGNLPPGLTLAATGTPATTITGTPTSSGTYTFTVNVQDDATPKNTDSKQYSITVGGTVTILTTSPLQGGYVGAFYKVPLYASSVCGNYTWSVASGSLPLGLSIVGGNLQGTPTAAGTSFFTLLVKDGGNNTATSNLFSLTINSAPGVFTIATGDPLQNGIVGMPYNYSFVTVLGFAPFSWSYTGILPPGLNFSGGTISGTPTTPSAAGNPFTFTVTVVDSFGRTASKTFHLTINAGPYPIRTTGNQNVQVCVGDYTLNCLNAGTATLKTGLVDQFWSQARFGVMDFNKGSHSGNAYAYPNIGKCIEQSPGPRPNPDFMTAIENAVGIDPTTTLVNGEYEAINYYATATQGGNCDPYLNAPACVKSFNLILTAGVGADNPPTPSTFLTPEVFSSGTPSACTLAALSNLAKNSCYGYNVGDLRSDYAGRQYVTTYIVNTMGTPTTGPSYDPSTAPGAGNTGNILYQAAKYGGGIYYEVTNAGLLKKQLEIALLDIIKRAAAGTAASVLASGEGSGANLIQAVFYPRKQFGNDEISWIGRLSNLWYYVDPRFANSNIREDDGDKVLHLKTDGTHHDYITQLYFDSSTETTKARRWEDPNGNGTIGTQLTPDIDFENLGNLWEAGSLLWSRNLTASPRTIYTSTTGTNLTSFSETNNSALSSFLTASTDSEAQAIIRWVSGWDTPFSFFTPSPDYRHRSVSINGVGPYTWKLGDVLNSTPKISSWLPLSGYHKIYGDYTYGVPGVDPSLLDAADGSHYITSARYKGRGTIFAGANDGMLHAFRLGTLQLNWSGMDPVYDKAKLSNNVCSGDTGINCVSDAQCTAASAGTCSSTVTLGEEVWAYIPKSVLPYLKYTADAGYGGCHLYSVDLTPYIFDASIGDPASGDVSDITRTPSHWRTILIGGMRYGGACRNIGTSCAGGGTDCVKTPVDGLGYSSYFALDITNQNSPTLLWEYSNPDLGFSTAGPAIVRISALTSGNPDKWKNGHWFVVLASGPTGPIDTTYKQFLGRSDQYLKLFVLNLKDGSLAATIPTGISEAFGGSMYNATLDTDLDYQDDVVYVPYVKVAADGTWTDGGVGRLSTKQNPDPRNWVWSTLMDGIGPVTSAVTKLQNNSTHTLWAFFGTGRYYFERGGTTDDGAGQRRIFGMKEPCFGVSGFDKNCTSTVSSGLLTDVTSTANIPANPDDPNFKGWYINLDGDGVPDASFRAERVITDPLATTSGIVFFTSYKPYSDQCALGGKSFIWAVKYNNGGGAGTLLQGKAIVQVSTGTIEQLNLSSAFTDAGGRKSAGMEGVPPTAQGLSILSAPAPVKRVLHIRER